MTNYNGDFISNKVYEKSLLLCCTTILTHLKGKLCKFLMFSLSKLFYFIFKRETQSYVSCHNDDKCHGKQKREFIMEDKNPYRIII
jgi:hypothetical protein